MSQPHLTTLTLSQTVARLNECHGRLSAARAALLTAEVAALSARFNLETAEGRLAAALLLAQADAPGTNETQRKAAAHAATAAQRETVAEQRAALLAAEVELTRAKTALRLADDERRAVETILALWRDGLLPAGGPERVALATEEDIPF
jgi:hypothetical protein